MNYFRRSYESRKLLILGGLFSFFVSVIMATFAANITINTNNRIEFGQGVYIVQACNSWIRISLSYGSTEGNLEGKSLITSFIIDGLDTEQCKSSNIEFKAFSESGQLDLFESEGGPESESRAVHNIITLKIDDEEEVTLVDELGSPFVSDLVFLSTDLTTKTYFVDFENPLAYVADLTSITVETGPNVDSDVIE